MEPGRSFFSDNGRLLCQVLLIGDQRNEQALLRLRFERWVALRTVPLFWSNYPAETYQVGTEEQIALQGGAVRPRPLFLTFCLVGDLVDSS